MQNSNLRNRVTEMHYNHPIFFIRSKCAQKHLTALLNNWLLLKRDCTWLRIGVIYRIPVQLHQLMRLWLLLPVTAHGKCVLTHLNNRRDAGNHCNLFALNFNKNKNPVFVCYTLKELKKCTILCKLSSSTKKALLTTNTFFWYFICYFN